MLLTFLLSLSIKQAISFGLYQIEVAEEMIEEGIVKPRPYQGNTLLNAIILHTGLYSYCVFQTERGEDAIDQVTPIYNRGRPKYTLFYLSEKKVRQLKKLFNWGDEEIKELKSRLKDNKYVMETFFDLFKKTKRDMSELRHFKRQ